MGCGLAPVDTPIWVCDVGLRLRIRATGYSGTMSDETTPDDPRVADRAELLPEEQAVGSDDPEAQAEAILAESDERRASRHNAPDSVVEHRTSEQVTPPTD